VLRHLKAERYIDNRRYAEAFVREKMALSGWGARKITDALRRKRIDTEIIREALAPLLSTTDMHQRVCTLLQRKLRTTKGKTTYEVRTKLIRYALSQGYDYEVVREAIDTLLTPDDSCEDLF
jgi:regulatory protein